METWVKGVGLRPNGKPSDKPPNPKAVARHSSIPTHWTLVVKYQELTPFPFPVFAGLAALGINLVRAGQDLGDVHHAH